MSDDLSKAAYKQLRNRVALGLGVLWMGGWYGYLDAQRVAAIQAMEACKSGTGLRAVSCAGIDFILPTESVAGAGLVFEMGIALLFAPLVLLPAGYLARRYLAAAEARAQRRDEAAQNRLLRRQQQESAARIAQSEAESDAARRQISRGEVIHKLGTINDLTDLLPAGGDEERMLNVRHGVAQALRELAAKYTVPELTGLITSDPIVKHTARRVIERLEGSPLGTIAEIEVLRLATR